MELAVRQGFDVKVVTLPHGQDPADAPEGFADRLSAAEDYLVYRVRLEIERAADRQEAFVRAREVLAKAEDSPERQEALRLLADRLDLPRETLSGLAPGRGRGCEPARGAASARRRRPSRARRPCGLRRACIPRAGSCGAHAGAFRLGHEPTLQGDARLRQGGCRSDSPPGGARCASRAGGDRRADGSGAPARLRERKLKRDLSGADLAHHRAAGAPLQGASGARRVDVAELAEKLAGLIHDIAELRLVQIRPEAPDRACMHSIEARDERLDGNAEVPGERGGDDLRTLHQLLVAHLESSLCGPGGAHVPTPDPGGAPRIGRGLELVAAIGSTQNRAYDPYGSQRRPTSPGRGGATACR